MRDIIDDLRSVRDAAEYGSAQHSIFDRAFREIERVRKQNDDLQARGTALVMANRDLRAQIAGHPVVRVQRVGSHDLPLPAYATHGAAGMDLRADLSQFKPGGDSVRAWAKTAADQMKSIWLDSGGRIRIHCGFAFEIPDGYLGDVRGRSGWTERGVYVSHGLIDPDYRGVVGIHVENRSDEPVEIEHGDRIAQLVIAQAPQARIEEASELSETTRNTAGFGSTGVR